MLIVVVMHRTKIQDLFYQWVCLHRERVIWLIETVSKWADKSQASWDRHPMYHH